MSQLFQFLGTSSLDYIETGVVVTSLGNNRYTIRIRGRELALRSAVDERFSIGSHVIINRTGYQRYIIGSTKQLKTSMETEVIVDG